MESTRLRKIGDGGGGGGVEKEMELVVLESW